MVEMTPEIQTRSPKELVAEQSKHIEEIGKTKFLDISPENPKDVPIIFLPGWSADIRSLSKFYVDAVERDRRIITEQYPVERLKKLPKVNIEGTTVSAQANARTMADYIESKGIKRVKAVGHSEGAGVTLTLVEELRRRGITLEAAVLVAPTGVGHPTAKELGTGVKKMMKYEWERSKRDPTRLKGDYLKVIRDGIKFGLRHGLRGKWEGEDIANINMITLLENALDEGVDIGILHSGDKDLEPSYPETTEDEIHETDPLVHIADLATDIESAQKKRRTKAVDELRASIPDLLTNPDARKRFDDQIAKFIEEEEKATPIVMPSPDAGHLYLDYAPGTYMPHSIEMLDYLAKQRRENPRSPKPPLMALPETTG